MKQHACFDPRDLCAWSRDKMTSYDEHEVHYAGDKHIHYLQAGPTDSQLLIFVHGWPAIAKTWQPQLDFFAARGYRVVAPDMPGSGQSTARKGDYADYSMQSVVQGLLALLEHLGREQAIWIGHDWGCPPVWALTSTHPEVCTAVAGLAVPYRSIELGLQEVLRHVNRAVYPEDRYPFGQWSYQLFYEREFEKATREQERNVETTIGVMYVKGKPGAVGKPAVTAEVLRNGSWLASRGEPSAANSVIDVEMKNELVAAFEKTGLWPTNAYYMNHGRNREYFLQKQLNGGVLDMPVLFIEAKYDRVCDTAESTLADGMRESCRDLSYVSVEAGHWVGLEKPEEVNEALLKWIEAKVPGCEPGRIAGS